MKYKKVMVNKAKCKKCGEILESKFNHDFKTCSCKSLSVDGGLDYIRRSCKDKNLYEEMSEFEFIDMPY